MKISKADYEALPASLKTAFKAVEGSDEYDNGEEEAGSLKSALEKEREEKKRAAKERDERQAELDKLADERKKAEDDAARKKGDFGKIEEDYKKRIADLETEKARIAEESNRAVAALAEDGVIKDVSSIFVAPGAMAPMIKTRLKTEIVDGKAVTRVLDADGNPTSLGVSDLKKEFLDNKEFKSILVASKGTGGGATVPGGGGGATTSGKIDAANAPAKDLVAHLEAKGVGAESE